ncbi:DUF2971 domain-containing protein [Yersinia ruckeri]
MSVPNMLFKYKPFNADSMELILEDYLYFANPNQFNDPLDCKVSIFDDINNENELKFILSSLYQKNTEKRLNDAAKKLHYKGQKTIDKISYLSLSEAERMVSEIYINFDFYHEGSSSITEALANSIGNIILSGYNKGVLSLAEDSDCPLMWSHYADNHKGICLGYTIPDNIKSHVHSINYTGDSREITTSQIKKMLTDDKDAKREIEDSIFLRKASSWAYEKEWRMISTIGIQNSSIYLSEIVFGLRCKNTTIFSIMKSLQNRDIQIRFFQIIEVPKKFTLEKIEITFDNECIHGLPCCSEKIDEMMNDL